MYVDELEDNPCREIVVWRPKNPVLTGDFQWLFDFLRENSSEMSPNMVIPEVVYPPEVDAPTPSRNLAAIFKPLRMEILIFLLLSMKKMLLWKKLMLRYIL